MAINLGRATVTIVALPSGVPVPDGAIVLGTYDVNLSGTLAVVHDDD
jgi:hypothetical protein